MHQDGLSPEDEKTAKFGDYPRTNNYWVATYSVSGDPRRIDYGIEAPSGPPSTKFLWPASNKGPSTMLVLFSDLRAALDSAERRKETRRALTTALTFSDCDFRGDWGDPVAFVTFHQCQFRFCCFSYSVWINVKFQDCTFEHCDFDIVTFEDCAFTDGCKFVGITASATHTKFRKTQIRTSTFLAGVVANTSSLEGPANKNKKLYQLARLAKTKMKVAGNLLTSTREADPEDYFDAYRSFTLLHKEKKIARNLYRWQTGLKGDRPPDQESKDKLSVFARLAAGVLIYAHGLEYWVTLISGKLNNWGESLLRPILFALGVLLFFGLIYWRVYSVAIGDAFLYGADMLLLAGYSKYTLSTCSLPSWLVFLNLLFGVYWYSIFIPTILRQTIRN